MIIVPEVKDNVTVGVTLLQAGFVATSRPTSRARSCRDTRAATARCVDAVTETTPTFDDARLATIDILELLTEPVYVLADRWR